ncbi:MAG: radical SAM protein [Proteobacteria bacterium]|nr:radical SAM protein [Pseudomonadota bacterium]
MGRFQSLKQRILPPAPKPMDKGIHVQRSPLGAEERFRLHLRVEDNGEGILVINASRVLHVNQTAAEYIKLLMEGKDVEAVVKEIRKRYRVSAKQAREDYQGLRDTIDVLTKRDDICPISYLNVERIEPFDTPISAPYRMDLALTYRCDNECSHCYVGRPRDMAELDTAQWRGVTDRLWDIGIPHVCFTGGEATLRDDLTTLIAHAQEVGIVTGLLTNGRRLSERSYLDELVDSGLDHVQITLESHDEGIHNQIVGAPAWRETVQGIKNALTADLYTITNTTLGSLNAPRIEETVGFLSDLGVNTFACNGLIYSGKAPESGIGIPEEELEGILVRISDAANRYGMRLIWYTPTRYHVCDPLQLELGVKRCTAAKYNMCIEPNGDVIPCQSYYSALGNILENEWSEIWNHPTAKALRDRDWVSDACRSCPNFVLCGGGCPLYSENQNVLCVESKSTAV